jgi:hypothetical protein
MDCTGAVRERGEDASAAYLICTVENQEQCVRFILVRASSKQAVKMIER